MNLPKQYQWLTKIPQLPRTIAMGLEFYGLQEVVGKGSNKTILDWRDLLNAAGVNIFGYSDDDIPWCGLFVALICFRRRNNKNEVVTSPLWARNWLNYGTKVKVPMLGDVLIFSRGSGGHVGFYIGENSTHYFVLGGNQGNRVSIVAIEKSRLLGARRPPYKVQPSSVSRYFLTTKGEISRNEA